jgi:hypothetical protein
MTTEYAVFAGAFLLAVALIWKAYRVIDKRLSDIHAELGELHTGVSHLFLFVTKSAAKGSKAEPSSASAECNAGEVAHTPAPLPSPGLEAELAEVHDLCAKLITLVPPVEAAPLLREQGPSEGPLIRFEGRKPLRPGPLGSPSVKRTSETE